VEWWVQVRQGSSQVQACSALRVVCLRPCSISRATDAQHRVSLGQRSVARLALPSHYTRPPPPLITTRASVLPHLPPMCALPPLCCDSPTYRVT